MKLMIKNIATLMEQCGYHPIDLVETPGLDDSEHDAVNGLLNKYCFLNARVSDILKMTSHSMEDILYSKYYWFDQYKKLAETYTGEDPELEHIQFQMMEQIMELSKGRVDWDLLEAIEESKPWLSPTLVEELQPE
ncbi:hypothetical protein [Feifania hominis]|uniref:Uncharacterized protein n=1 Tax=Feifania hominis TaxID=2763660 RepID=A0A926DH05_9FIRM|nr:hypothetical protein [Feifania hominis]MBC8537134.1 hypothetical protein [Feifania hominis]